jgi:hypothetical protein
VVDYDPLCAAARLLARRGHSLTVMVPEAVTEPPEKENDALTPVLDKIYRRVEQRRVREARGYFGRLGVTVNVFGPGGVAAPLQPRERPTGTRVA